MPLSLNWPQKILKVLLGVFLVYAGLGHLFWARHEFLAQVPPWLPLSPDLVVLLSGLVEITLGAGLVLLRGDKGATIGILTALFFVAVFPGNIAQYVEGRSAFGLDTDKARLIRLFFQPVLVAWALWTTGAWRTLRGKF